VPVTFGLFGLSLGVVNARWIGLAGLTLALIGAAVIGLPLRHALQLDESARIKFKYGSILIDAGSNQAPADEHQIILGTIDDLAKLAEKHGTMILHETAGATHRYSVHDGHATYCYNVPVVPERPDQDGTDQDQHPDRATLPVASFAAPLAEPVPHTSTIVWAAAGEQRAWQPAFLAALRATGNASLACQQTGISITLAYRERIQVPAFAEAWNQARAAAQNHTFNGAKTT
jgi:hypothetical protein